MPDFAEIEGPISCPYCANQLCSKIDILWGKVPYAYKVGDKIKWKKHRNGELVDSFVVDEGQRTWNCGVTDLQNLLVFDGNFYAPEEGGQCPRCGEKLGGAMAVIEDGRITATKMLSFSESVALLGDAIGRADIVELKKDGSKVIREDLYDLPITYRFRKR